MDSGPAPRGASRNDGGGSVTCPSSFRGAQRASPESIYPRCPAAISGYKSIHCGLFSSIKRIPPLLQLLLASNRRQCVIVNFKPDQLVDRISFGKGRRQLCFCARRCAERYYLSHRITGSQFAACLGHGHFEEWIPGPRQGGASRNDGGGSVSCPSSFRGAQRASPESIYPRWNDGGGESATCPSSFLGAQRSTGLS